MPSLFTNITRSQLFEAAVIYLFFAVMAFAAAVLA